MTLRPLSEGPYTQFTQFNRTPVLIQLEMVPVQFTPRPRTSVLIQLEMVLEVVLEVLTPLAHPGVPHLTVRHS
jgi:hypothetical protein